MPAVGTKGKRIDLDLLDEIRLYTATFVSGCEGPRHRGIV